MTEIAERFRRVADGLTQTIATVPDAAWGNPSPCDGWDGRDVVRHLVEWLSPPGFLLGASVEMTCTPDVLVHTWDLAQAAGLDVELDAEAVARQARGIEALAPGVDEAMRASGHFGPRIEVPADADARTRVLAFNGRRATP